MPSPRNDRIVIIGAGPTGLGAAYRLRELGHANWDLYEQADHIGGLSASFTDAKGFTWDIGGHVMFSRQPQFNDLADRLLGRHYLSHEREAWIRMQKVWVPYPFQNNLRHLPREIVLDCLKGLLHAQGDTRPVNNFGDWIQRTFGDGIATHFMLPYNFKVWATPATSMASNWIAERVSVITFEKALTNVIMNTDDTGWGPNNTFKFPLHGGTGGFVNAFRPYVSEKLHCRKKAASVDVDAHTVTFSDGATEHYDILINTSPLDLFVGTLTAAGGVPGDLLSATQHLKHNGVYIIGIGLKKKIPGTKCWVYFPDQDIPFYRMTYFSHYSPYNVPGGDTNTYSSLICEVSFSEHKEVNGDEVVDRTVDGLMKAGILQGGDRDRIVSTWLHKENYGYPIPTRVRDEALLQIQPFLESNDIFSRGRFGAWKYEIGNMDHSITMGIELIDRIVANKAERLWTL